MERRVPESQRTPEALRDLIDGKLVSSDARSELIKLAAQVIIEEALEAERGRPGDRGRGQRAIFRQPGSPAM